MKRTRGTLIAAAVILAFGGLIVYGGFAKYADQTSGVAGKATVTDCTTPHNTKYVHTVSRCGGHWQVEGNAIIGGIGPIDGADAGDVGKTIDVRIHGTGHATVPDLKTPIVLWALGGMVVLFGLVVLRGWWRRR